MMDLQETFITNKWNQSFLTPDKTKNNSTLQTNPSTNTMVSFNFSKSNLLNDSSQITNRQMMSPTKIISERQIQHSINNNNNNNNPQVQSESLPKIITRQQISDFIKVKELLNFCFVQRLNLKQKEAATKKKNKQLALKVREKQKQVTKYRQKVAKQINLKNDMKIKCKSQSKLKRKQDFQEFYQIKREIKIIDNQIQTKVSQIIQLEEILQKKLQNKYQNYLNSSKTSKNLEIKNIKNIKKKLTQKQPVIYIPYAIPSGLYGQYPPPPYGQYQHDPNSVRSNTWQINASNNVDQPYSNELQKFNSFGMFNNNTHQNPNMGGTMTNKANNRQKVNESSLSERQRKASRMLSGKTSLHSSVKKWEGDQQDIEVIRLISESQKLKKSASQNQRIDQSVININMEASLQKTQNNMKKINIINKYEMSPRDKEQQLPPKLNSSKKEQTKKSKHLTSPKKDQNMRQSSINIEIESDSHSRSNSYDQSVKDQTKIDKVKRIRSPTVQVSKHLYEISNNFANQTQVIRISQEQNSGLSTPMFTGKQSPNLKLTNPIFQLQNLAESKMGQSNRIQKIPPPLSPVNIQGASQESQEQSFMEISLQVQSKISRQNTQNKKFNQAKSAILKSKKQLKKQQKSKQKQNNNNIQSVCVDQAQSQGHQSDDDFLDSINLLAVSRISKQKQRSVKSTDQVKNERQQNFDRIDSNLRNSNPSKIIKKGSSEIRQSNVKKSQRYSKKIPVTVQQEQEYEEQIQMKKISTARNSNPVQRDKSNSEDKKSSI